MQYIYSSFYIIDVKSNRPFIMTKFFYFPHQMSDLDLKVTETPFMSRILGVAAYLKIIHRIQLKVC